MPKAQIDVLNVPYMQNLVFAVLDLIQEIDEADEVLVADGIRESAERLKKLLGARPS